MSRLAGTGTTFFSTGHMPKPGQTAENSKNAEMTKISDVEKET